MSSWAARPRAPPRSWKTAGPVLAEKRPQEEPAPSLLPEAAGAQQSLGGVLPLPAQLHVGADPSLALLPRSGRGTGVGGRARRKERAACAAAPRPGRTVSPDDLVPGCRRRWMAAGPVQK